MNIIFFGSGEFALKSLEALAASPHKVILAITQPDRPKGRRLETHAAEVRLLADKLGIPAYQPQDPNSPEAMDFIKLRSADLFVVVSYGHILKDELLDLPKLYPLNIHASLLPKYRGSSPINWAIINGEKETGISIIKMNRFMDSGDILLQKKIAIEEKDNAQTLKSKLEVLAGEAIIEAIDLIMEGKAEFLKQDPSQVSLAPKLKKGDGLIQWKEDADSIVRKIKGLVPWPGAFTYYQGKTVKIWQARAINAQTPQSPPCKVIEIRKDGILVTCARGVVEVQELQPESSKRLSPEAFANGYRLSVGKDFA